MSEQRIPGRAGELLAELGERAVLHDLYDEVGSAVYHDMAGRDRHEVRELLALVRRTPGPVLDLAAGSGRLTLPLLALGREVTALDLSPSMLALLRERLAQAPAPLAERCTVVRGDMSDFSLRRRFPVVVLGTTSVSLLDQAGRARLYESVRAHLEPGGRFLLTTVDADPGYTGPLEIEQTYTTSGGTEYRIFDHWVPGDAVRTVTIFPAHPAHPADGPTAVCTSNVGVLPVGQLRDELAQAGFTVRSQQQLPAVSPRLTDVLLETESCA
ncbi:daptide-type RiPP biosynthesis methyltransferase [Streptomyces paromomycinus]|uniref:Methyltransferase n=1 Tax=Streptomyces paromomycinus TaxID=92743 RepID=A0A401W5U4_STREY|nr:daptide-type RiPP biosynthesis methyltransferase [Streptomyces paromomycinus]GCD44717.1 methyltransferase [Streptomyces paromomycinus]